MDFEINNNSEYIKKLNDEKELPRIKMHSFHRYYGKLIPAIPSLFIKEFSNEGDTIFDPFSGSGTTAVESIRAGRNFIGFEINPLAYNISLVKTYDLDFEILLEINSKIIELIKNKNYEISEEDYPYLLNRDHWFKDFVQKDLIKIKKSIDDYFENYSFFTIDKDKYKLFYYITLSAILRNVSNADTQHVFPGISKRMRKLESEGKIHIDVISSFERAIKKRALYYNEFKPNGNVNIILGDSSNCDITKYKDSADLIITNPPYISSVRYIETLKIEMYWMKYITSSNEYSDLAHLMLGNDRLLKSEYQTVGYTGYSEIDKQISDMMAIDVKSAKIIENFFKQIEKVIENMSIILKSGGKVVIKISDSKIKKTKIETGRYMSLIAEKYGFKIKDIFLDEINNNSRSLTTARNTYSDIITHDYIIIWEKQ